MSDILHKVQMFLDTACQKQVVIPDKLIDEFGEACKNAIKKQFTDKRPNKFTIRASNIGRPLCQLQMEKDGAKGESPPYSTKMRNLLGDLIEATAVLILKSSGVKIASEQKSVRYTFPDINLRMDLHLLLLMIVLDIYHKDMYTLKLIKRNLEDGLPLINRQENGQ